VSTETEDLRALVQLLCDQYNALKNQYDLITKTLVIHEKAIIHIDQGMKKHDNDLALLVVNTSKAKDNKKAAKNKKRPDDGKH